MNILLLQFNSVWKDSRANLDQLDQLFKLHLSRQSHEKTIDLVVLPETFHAGFSMQPETFAESLEGEISQHLSALARKYEVNIVAGVAQKQVRRQCDGLVVRFYNRSLVFNREGQQIASYTKQKLFSYANEQRVFQAGHKSEIVEIDGHPFGLFICYDLRFPELFRAHAKQVEGMIVIANWPDTRQLHWEALLQARAIENQCLVIGVNRIGDDENGLSYAGGSSVISPLGKIMAYGEKATTAVYCEVNPDEIDEVRSQFPFLKDQ